MNRDAARVFCRHNGHEFYADGGHYCPTHGAAIFDSCDHCGKRWTRRIQTGYGGVYAAAPFCAECSYPAPWVSRRQLLDWLKDRITDERLEPAVTLELRELLDRLADMDPGDTRAAGAWQKIRQLAPRMWGVARPLLDRLISEAVIRLLEGTGSAP
jgi:hypothetical protein